MRAAVASLPVKKVIINTDNLRDYLQLICLRRGIKKAELKILFCSLPPALLRLECRTVATACLGLADDIFGRVIVDGVMIVYSNWSILTSIITYAMNMISMAG